MCYPTPGPRCSDHAEREYVETEKLFTNCTDPNQKILLGVKLKEKREVFESTPRGQNDLRREADATTGLKREELLLRLEKGRKTREQQLKDYHYAVKHKDTSYIDYMEEKGYQRGKYLDATGIAGMFLGKHYLKTGFYVENTHTLVSDELKVFVIPEKHQAVWGSCSYEENVGFVSDDILLSKVFRESLDISTPSPATQTLIMAWFQGVLKSKGYTHIASVNRVTQDVLVFPVNELEKMYSVSLKIKKRLGGSTHFVGGVEDIKLLLNGTVFEDGEVLQPAGTRKTVVYGVPPQAKENCDLNHELYLSWREAFNGEDGYFEVRRRHMSTNFNISVCLKVLKPVTVSGIAKPGSVAIDEEVELVHSLTVENAASETDIEPEVGIAEVTEPANATVEDEQIETPAEVLETVESITHPEEPVEEQVEESVAPPDPVFTLPKLPPLPGVVKSETNTTNPPTPVKPSLPDPVRSPEPLKARKHPLDGFLTNKTTDDD